MSEQESPSIWAVLMAALSVIGGLIAALWAVLRRDDERLEKRLDEHIKDDVKIHEEVAVSKERLDRMEDDIGDHDSGLRGQVHKLAGDISPYVIKEQQKRKE